MKQQSTRTKRAQPRDMGEEHTLPQESVPVTVPRASSRKSPRKSSRLSAPHDDRHPAHVSPDYEPLGQDESFADPLRNSRPSGLRASHTRSNVTRSSEQSVSNNVRSSASNRRSEHSKERHERRHEQYDEHRNDEPQNDGGYEHSEREERGGKRPSLVRSHSRRHEHTKKHEFSFKGRHHRDHGDPDVHDEPVEIAKKEIFISAALNEIRIAITEEERLAELLWELPEKERQVGNLYLGKVQRIIQGMNAAFVDIGLKQDAFLHFSDVDEKDEFSDDDDDDDEPRAQGEVDAEPLTKAAATALRKTITAPRNVDKLPTFKTKSSGDVKINLTSGQDIIVQVVREAYSSKGFRVSSKISLPGRYMVLLPFSGSVGISKKIRNIKERKRLRSIARSILPPEVGCIVRTEAEDRDDAVLRKDFEELLRLWREVESKVKRASKPGLVHRDMSMTNSLMRDLLTENVKRVVVDSKKLYKEIDKYVEWAAPHMRKHIEFYDPIANARESMFHAVGVEQEIALAVSRRVPLPSGGYLIIEQTEAMVVIDVNSGRFTGEREQEQNSLRINMEAAREIARQLRIRDIGGMVVTDFIDMQEEGNRRKLVSEMHRFMRPDRAKFVIYPLTQLGLMQITRQRIRQSISQVLSDTCPACSGTGIVKSPLVVISDIERWVQKFIASPHREFRIELYVHPSIAKDLTEGTFSKLTRLMVKYFVKITLRQDEHHRLDEFRFMSIRKQCDITDTLFV